MDARWIPYRVWGFLSYVASWPPVAATQCRWVLRFAWVFDHLSTLPVASLVIVSCLVGMCEYRMKYRMIERESFEIVNGCLLSRILRVRVVVSATSILSLGSDLRAERWRLHNCAGPKLGKNHQRVTTKLPWTRTVASLPQSFPSKLFRVKQLLFSLSICPRKYVTCLAEKSFSACASFGSAIKIRELNGC